MMHLKERKCCHLTIDDGPSPNFVNLVKWIESKNISATFFCVGHKIRSRMNDIIWAMERGHTIANHSYSHPNFKNLKILQAQAEIIATQSLLNKAAKIAKVDENRIFRFPFGVRVDLSDFLKKEGFNNPWHKIVSGTDVLWTFDTLDYRIKRGVEIEKLLSRKIAPKDHVVLIHDSGMQYFDDFKILVEFTIKQGCKFKPRLDLPQDHLLDQFPVSS